MPVIEFVMLLPVFLLRRERSFRGFELDREPCEGARLIPLDSNDVRPEVFEIPNASPDAQRPTLQNTERHLIHSAGFGVAFGNGRPTAKRFVWRVLYVGELQ